MSLPYPTNEAPTEYEILPVIKKRWSPLAFSNEPIEPEKINRLFEALHWAPSSYNVQPWRVIYATQDDRESFDRVASLLVEGNSWAKQAYLLLLICAVPNFEHNGKPNRHHAYDTGAALENLFLQATAMDLAGHEMAGFDAEKAYDLLGIPKDVVVLTMMAVGYPGEIDKLSPDLLTREKSPRARKPISEVIFKGKWIDA